MNGKVEKRKVGTALQERENCLKQLGFGEEGFFERKFIYTRPDGVKFRDARITGVDQKDFLVNVDFGNSGHALDASPARLKIQED